MYWFWYFLFATQPEFLLVGMTGCLGREAKQAADDAALMLGLVFLLVVALAAVGGLVYLILKGTGTIQ